MPGFKLVASEQEAQVRAELVILGGRRVPGAPASVGHTRARARVPVRSGHVFNVQKYVWRKPFVPLPLHAHKRPPRSLV